jgi:uncharacterized protein (TIGR02996 family)
MLSEASSGGDSVMTEEELLFAAIRANPEEDTPRLAYADWLDEHVGDRTPTGTQSRSPRRKLATGSERAEYIRLSCELARLRVADPSPAVWGRIKELKAREKKLKRSVKRAWEQPFQNGKPFEYPPDFIGMHGFGFSFDRGLPGGVQHFNDSVLKYGEDMIQRTSVYFFNLHSVSTSLLTRLLATPWLQQLPQLWIQSADSEEGHEPPDLSQFADSPYTDGLTVLGMSGAWSLTPIGADRLAVSTSLQNLRSLSLYDTVPEASGFARLFQGVAFRRLAQLHLGELPFNRGELVAILGSSALATVEDLCLHKSVNKAEGEALARSAMWANLRKLDLLRLKPDGAQSLESAPPSRLETLTLWGLDLVEEHVRSLVRWPIWQSLRALDLEGTADLSPSDWGELIRAMSAGSIRNLNLGRCSVDDRVARQIADASHLAELRTLNLSHTRLTDAGALALAESASLSRLRDLRLEGCQISLAARRKFKKRFGAAVHFEPVDDD